MSNPRARALRCSATDAERLLWRHLRGKQCNHLKFRRQEPIGDCIVDFVCYETRLVIEVDGGQHAADVERDTARTHWLQSQGFRVVRFWNHEVLTNIDGVLEVIVLKSEEPPHPSPLPPGERE